MKSKKSTKRKGKLNRNIRRHLKNFKSRLKAKRSDDNPVRKYRSDKVRRRKNFFSSFLLTVLLWLLLFCFVYIVDPDNLVSRILFFVFEFLVVLFTTSFVFANSRRGLISASVVTIFLILRLFGIGNILNLGLLVGLGVCIEYYKS